MKYTKGNITLNVVEDHMRSVNREQFIAEQKDSGLSEADLGKYWDLVNGKKEETPVVIGDIVTQEKMDEIMEELRETAFSEIAKEEEKKPKQPRNRSTKNQGL